MAFGHPDHGVILQISQHAVQTDTGHTIIITEYRADGCVTWREA